MLTVGWTIDHVAATGVGRMILETVGATTVQLAATGAGIVVFVTTGATTDHVAATGAGRVILRTVGVGIDHVAATGETWTVLVTAGATADQVAVTGSGVTVMVEGGAAALGNITRRGGRIRPPRLGSLRLARIWISGRVRAREWSVKSESSANRLILHSVAVVVGPLPLDAAKLPLM